MGWFDEQIKNRIQNDRDAFAQSFADLSAVVMGRRATASAQDEQTLTVNALGDILKYYHVKLEELPPSLTDLDEQLEYLLRPSGIMRRPVKLSGDWYDDAVGPLLGRLKDGAPIALMPHGLKGYSYFDHDLGKSIRITKKNAPTLELEALCFYRPFPMRSIGIPDLLYYTIQTLSLSDFILVLLVTLITTLMGLFSPYVSSLLYGKVIPSGAPALLLPLTGLMAGVTLSTMLLGITHTLVMGRIQTKLDISVSAASMMRIFSLPAAFFKNYSSGELASRIGTFNGLCNTLFSTIFTTGLTSVFSLIYIGQIFYYAPGLIAVSPLVPFCTILIGLSVTFLQMARTKRMMEQSSKLSGLVYALFTGIQKLKLAGAERRAFAKWGHQYAKVAELQYAPPLYLRLMSLLSTAITTAGMLYIYWYAITAPLPLADYMAFNISYGMVSGSFMSLSAIALSVATIKPTLDMVTPILKAVPETALGKKVITHLSGGIELNNVSFRYNDNVLVKQNCNSNPRN